MRYDYHAHTTYSDGSDMREMAAAAAEAGLDGLGFTDHCNVSTDEPGASLPHDLMQTYRDRRRDIESLREAVDVRVFDAVEMDYRPADEREIETFLGEAGFQYSIGSVHHLEGLEVMHPGDFTDLDEAAAAEFVDRYFDRVIDLVESELFDVVAHLDVSERNPELRGYTTDDQYDRVASALATSETVPELNAGRVFTGPETVHPNPDYLEAIGGRGVPFVPGTDAHTPQEIRDRVPYLDDVIEEYDVETVDLDA